MRELAAPVVSDENDPVEMARVWITAGDGRSHVALYHGIFGDQELRLWGSLAADLIAHAVRATMMDGSDQTPEEAFALVEAGFRDRLADNPTLAGVFSDRKIQ
ncbi:hypothetical protein BH10PSE4_BH10PSE4_48160 [soil metagenome]